MEGEGGAAQQVHVLYNTGKERLKKLRHGEKGRTASRSGKKNLEPSREESERNSKMDSVACRDGKGRAAR